MIGQATARLESVPRRWIQRLWGHGDIDMRQKWWAIWPHLAELPTGRLDVLDAGCGAGRWTLELAARRPEWRIQGIDRDGPAIRMAEATRQRLGVDNVSFVQSDYFAFQPPHQFDLVLAVSSALYLAEQGDGLRLFRTYSKWLKPGGRLILIDTRWDGRSPFFTSLPHPRKYHNVFSFEELSQVCDKNGLLVERLSGHVGRLGIAAKQLGWVTNKQPCPARQEPSKVRALHPALYPARLAMAWLDSRREFRREQLTLMWLLVARLSPHALSDSDRTSRA
jgi:SAM-dependent methyltransferase